MFLPMVEGEEGIDLSLVSMDSPVPEVSAVVTGNTGISTIGRTKMYSKITSHFPMTVQSPLGLAQGYLFYTFSEYRRAPGAHFA